MMPLNQMPLLLLPGGNATTRRAVLANSGLTLMGHLLTPNRTLIKSGLDFVGQKFGIDNECFVLGDRFDPSRYLKALWRIAQAHPVGNCLFATAPDVVGDAKATLNRFAGWARVIRGIGLPVALVAQDGLEGLNVPWGKLDALFIGGSTEWKMGAAAASLLAQAKAREKWTHVGRVNSFAKLDQLKVKPDSIDGTNWIKTPDTNIREWANMVQQREMQPRFNLEVETWEQQRIDG